MFGGAPAQALLKLWHLQAGVWQGAWWSLDLSRWKEEGLVCWGQRPRWTIWFWEWAVCRGARGQGYHVRYRWPLAMLQYFFWERALHYREWQAPSRTYPRFWCVRQGFLSKKCFCDVFLMVWSSGVAFISVELYPTLCWTKCCQVTTYHDAISALENLGEVSLKLSMHTMDKQDSCPCLFRADKVVCFALDPPKEAKRKKVENSQTLMLNWISSFEFVRLNWSSKQTEVQSKTCYFASWFRSCLMFWFVCWSVLTYSIVALGFQYCSLVYHVLSFARPTQALLPLAERWIFQKFDPTRMLRFAGVWGLLCVFGCIL